MDCSGEVGEGEVEVFEELVLGGGVVVVVGDGADGHGLCVVEGGGPSDGCGLHVFDGDVVVFEEVEFVVEGVEGVAGGDGGAWEVDG